MTTRPTPLLSLSPCGRRFILRCPHCGISREEPVDPARNPYPFSYLSNCSSCHTRLHVDHQQIAGIQNSYARAAFLTPFGAIPADTARVVPAIYGAKAPIAGVKKIPATVAMAGNEGGESQCTGSPAYLALNRASAAVAKVVRPSVLRFEGSSTNLFTKGLTMTMDTPIFPVAQLTIGPIPKMGIIVVRPDFLTHLSQKPEEADEGRTYALTPVQARYLAERILAALDVLEKSPEEAPPGAKH